MHMMGQSGRISDLRCPNRERVGSFSNLFTAGGRPRTVFTNRGLRGRLAAGNLSSSDVGLADGTPLARLLA
jgi:hypothetical protein